MNVEPVRQQAVSKHTVIAPQEHGWAVHTWTIGGYFDGHKHTSYFRWKWQARREYDRRVRR